MADEYNNKIVECKSHALSNPNYYKKFGKTAKTLYKKGKFSLARKFMDVFTGLKNYQQMKLSPIQEIKLNFNLEAIL